MKAYLAIKYHVDHSNRGRIEGLTAVLESVGYETICITRDVEKWGTVSFTPPALMKRSFKLIDTCDILVVELTEKGVGVGIEAGYAHARDIPIITIAQEDAPISDTLCGISAAVIHYNHYSDLTVPFAAFKHT